MLGGRIYFVLPPLFAYSSQNRPRRVPSYPMPVTEQPVATYLPKVAFDAKLAECISKTDLSLPRTKRQFSVHAECPVLDFRSSPFCIMHPLYHFFRACQSLFLKKYSNFCINFFDRYFTKDCKKRLYKFPKLWYNGDIPNLFVIEKGEKNEAEIK